MSNTQKETQPQQQILLDFVTMQRLCKWKNRAGRGKNSRKKSREGKESGRVRRAGREDRRVKALQNRQQVMGEDGPHLRPSR